MTDSGLSKSAADELRGEYDLTKLHLVPKHKRHGIPAENQAKEQLELTGGFPEFDEDIPEGFEWDAIKAASNFKKHNVTFNEASTTFTNPHAAEVYDPDHSDDEDRFLRIGHSARGRLIILSFTDREGKIRIISARTATPAERRSYENGEFEQ